MATDPETHRGTRAERLHGMLNKFLSGERAVVKQNTRLFLEAFCSQSNAVRTVERLLRSNSGLKALQSALFSDASSSFLNAQPTDLLLYIQDRDLALVGGGSLLRDVLLSIVDPPIFWDAFVEAHRGKTLTKRAVQCFAWLLLQLIHLSTESASSFYATAQDDSIQQSLLDSLDPDVRSIGKKIKSTMSIMSSHGLGSGDSTPGGRHDNDDEDIRKISIFPTKDELLSSKAPFIRRASEVEDIAESTRLGVHIDNQFRLLREDMLRDLKEELQTALGSRKGRSRGLHIDGLMLEDIDCDDKNPWTLMLKCSGDLPRMPKDDRTVRLKFLREHPNFLRHQSVSCMLVDSQVTALVSINRKEHLLARIPPAVCVQCTEEKSLHDLLVSLKKARPIRLVQLNTATFAYEPVLRQLQNTKLLALGNDLVSSTKVSASALDTAGLQAVIDIVEQDYSQELKTLLSLPRRTTLDASQAKCFVAGLSQRLSLIQGPPGTGKSFIGALILKALYLYSSHKSLVICYTNHALDQFLEDLLDVGIDSEHIVRLGSYHKASSRTKPLVLSSQSRGSGPGKDYYSLIKDKQGQARAEASQLHVLFSEYASKAVTKTELLEYIEFEVDPQFFDALALPEIDDGMSKVGKKGKIVDKFYLLDQWCRGQDSGIYPGVATQQPGVWQMPPTERRGIVTQWKAELLKERALKVQEAGARLNTSLSEIAILFGEQNRMILREKRIIACTTTAAAKYVSDIQSVSPELLLVEEAGEVLESHILTALGSNTKQLIMIGDHQQLRPKVHYDLSIAKGTGYNLDVSLFERLVRKGYPHEVLSQQHRMRPEFSSLVKHLTYPDLTDAAQTKERPDIRGIQDNLIFLNHEHQEDSATDIPDPRDNTISSSRKNLFEARMALRCVRYLAQQGYGTKDIVVLTPYLAQLRLLIEALGKENDPVLNDMDSYDLVRAGLVPTATAELMKRPLRISSIDNYQGEESDIVIVSLTRSNANGDIGFLSSHERLNVLLSRAKNGMILIGNAGTFLDARKGKELWRKFLSLLKDGSHVYNGLPVQCAQHPDRKSILCCPEDFDRESPDGGCDEPCRVMLQCKKHACPQRCHQLSDHSKMPCLHLYQDKCSRGHKLQWKCNKGKPSICHACEREDKIRDQKLKEEFKRQRTEQAAQDAHAIKIAQIDEEIRALIEARASKQKIQEMSEALERKQRDLEQARNLAQARIDRSTPKPSSDEIKKATVTNRDHLQDSNQGKSSLEGVSELQNVSLSEQEWSRQKRLENASSDAIDSIMGMTGLENVKKQVLDIKSKIEIAQRQGVDLTKERFGAVLLGNPGTGKTTIARLYAKFLTSFGILPGSEFFESTGSRLASDGVAGAKACLESIVKAGGGAFFIDEAYQLASGHSYGGAAVLDFLLAEIENLTGKVVFILAGYNKQMEKFFQHNQGFSSRMPYSLQFADYTDSELLLMFQRSMMKKYNGRMVVESGYAGLFPRIVIRRLGRGRDCEGFGNARALENTIARIGERQAKRVQRERVAGKKSDDFALTKEDLIGPDPSKVLPVNSAWRELQDMIGLKMVKDSIHGLFDRIQINYLRELEEKPLVEVSLNRVFLGSPGTGKTTVGKLYGQVLSDVGLLSNGEVIIKNPADFIGSIIGETEKNTKAILESSQGKVLIIDEAYMFYSGNSAGGNTTDSYRTAAIDTLVAEVQSTPGEDRCVLLLGYKDKLEEMFQNTNPGLARRFPFDDAFEFEDFSDDELRQILDLKLKKQGLYATKKAKETALDVLAKARRRMNFGNGGAVENIISRAKNNHQKRFFGIPVSERPIDIVFEPQDFDEDFDRVANATLSCRELFKDMVGSEEVFQRLERYTKTTTNVRARGLKPEDYIPFNFIFKGPPGTGKTTTARKMGQIFYDMGLLSSPEVCECSATDLIGQYVGQTGPKTTKQLEKALGKVLFIDEAYRLGEGNFATEATNELVDNLTKAKFAGKMIVILAGYEDAMNQLLSVNQGLASRFPEDVMFKNMEPQHCMQLLQDLLKKSGIEVDEADKDQLLPDILDSFASLSNLRSWGNGRDINTLSKIIISQLFQDADEAGSRISVTHRKLVSFLKTMLEEKVRREATVTTMPIPFRQGSNSLPSVSARDVQAPNQTAAKSTSRTASSREAKPSNPTTSEPGMVAPPSRDERDPEVSSEVWAQLQADKAAEELAKTHRLQALSALNASAEQAETEANQAILREQEAAARSSQAAAAAKAEARLDKEKEAAEAAAEAVRLKALHEAARLERLEALRVKAEAEERVRRARVENARRVAEEERKQEKLRQMGVCVAGFRWIKQAGGYRCAGGSHFVGDRQLMG